MKMRADEFTCGSMTRRRFGVGTCALFAAAVLRPARLYAVEPSTEGFISLFNGRDLEGWHTNSGRIGHGTGGLWQVEDGVLTGEQNPPGSGNGGLLLTDRQLADFELLIDMYPDWGPDSGVFFRCTEDGAGFQMYVDYHDQGNVGHLRRQR